MRFVFAPPTSSHLGTTSGLEVTAMSRLKPDGTRLSWRIAGFDQMLEAGRPFFIEWDDTNLHPGRSDVNGDAHIQSVVISGRWETWRRL